MLFTQHAITQAEFVHQQQIAGRRSRWRSWFGNFVIIAIFLTAIYSIISMILPVPTVDTPRYYWYDSQWEDYVLPFAVVWVFIMHFSVMFRTLGLSATVVSREHQGDTWDLLVLTGVDARQIVLGKWWAVIRRMRWSYFMLGLLRATVLLWVVFKSYYPLYYTYTNLTAAPMLPRLLAIVFTMAFIVLLTFLNLGFTAACGLSASPDHRNGAVALARAFGTRFLVIMATVLIPVGVVGLLFRGIDLNSSSFALGIGQSFATLLDNGLSLGYQTLIINLNDYSYNSFSSGSGRIISESLIFTIIFSVLFYALLTYAMLRFARWRAVKRGALQPLRPTAAKSA